ncbi:MAG: hypothetical protein N3F07_01185 [Candidatus Micrarchaeota archaeon]|nr:hypothetical protein [Candidatus Micrarchaeota archaeon]
MEFKRALVVANEKKPIAKALKRQVEGFLSQRGISLGPSRPQLIVSIGGDGTVLFFKKYYGVPFFAIGSSTSFICQARFSDWEEKLARALANPHFDRRLLLSCSLDGKPLPPVLNEIGIRNPQPRVLSIYLWADGKDYAFRADGVLFSTPTGSMAYAYSCGGKQMRKDDSRYQAVAISPFRRLFKPMILGNSSLCKVRISGQEKAQLFLDGQVAGEFTQERELLVRASKKPFYFLKA